MQLDRAQQVARGYRGHTAAFVRAYAQSTPGTVHVHLAHLSGSVVGAILTLSHAPSATYLIGWSGPKGRMVAAHHALLVHAATHLRHRGIATLDLGHVDSRRTPGLARFKWGTGARIVRTGGSWLGWPLSVRRVMHGA